MKTFKNIKVNILEKKITVILSKSVKETPLSDFLKMKAEISKLSSCCGKIEELIDKVERLEKRQSDIIKELEKIVEASSSGSSSSNSGGIGGNLVEIWAGANGYFTSYTYSENIAKKYTRRGEFLGEVEIPLKLLSSSVDKLSNKLIMNLEFNAEFARIGNVLFLVKLKDGKQYQIPYSFTASQSSGGTVINKTRYIRFSIETTSNSEVESIETNHTYWQYNIGIYNYNQKGTLKIIR